MRVGVNIVGDLAKIMEEEEKRGRKAVSLGVRAGGEGLKAGLRAQVTAAGLGTRLPRTIRSAHYPSGSTYSMDAASQITFQAPDIIAAFDQGALIRATKGMYLAIPTPAAGARGRRGVKLTPRSWEQRTGMQLRFVSRPGKVALLVAENARLTTRGRAARNRRKNVQGQTVVVFILVPQVQLRKRLDIQSEANKWAASIPSLILGNWED